jgi:protein-disulfide isomerase
VYCKRLIPLLEQVLDTYPDKVKIVYKNFPLKMHKYAQNAAIAALAAHRQGKFWAFHDLLFENYKKPDDQKIKEIAQQLELDLKAFENDLKNPEIAAKVQRDLIEGQKVGVRGTPTIFVNGRRLKDRSLQGFKTLIDKQLGK